MKPGRTLLLASALILGVTTSHADSKKAEAKKHYDLGKAHYNLKDWDKAIGEFKVAYDMFPDPVNLYNIAQAYRLKDECADAATYYARYQNAEKNKKLRDSVTQVRAKMEECAASKPREPLPVPPPVPPVVGQPPQPAPPVASGAAPQPLPPPMTDNAMRSIETPNPDPNRNRRILGYVLLGTGGVFVLGGVVNSFKVSDLDNKLANCDDFGCEGDQDPDELQDKRDRASINANAGYAIGFTGLIVGGLIYAVSRKPKQDTRVTVSPTRGGAVFSWSF